jgi:hypothetical protein
MCDHFRSLSYLFTLMAATILATALVSNSSAFVDTSSVAHSRPVISLRFEDARVPPILNSQVRTRGRFPTVAAGQDDAMQLNRQLRLAVISDEHVFLAAVHRWHASPLTSFGLYQLSPVRHLLSASSRVIGILIPRRAIRPGANDPDTWFALTLDAQTGRRVRIAGLFQRPNSGLRIFASATRAALKNGNRCVRNSLASGDSRFKHSLAPTPENYSHFTLLSQGIAVGFGAGDVAGLVCGRVVVIIPYAKLWHALSTYGKHLASGARTPT